MKKAKTTKGFSFYFTDALMTRVFFAVLIVVAVLALIPALRPKYSESEKRELTKFPKFSFEALADGTYFDNINLWYADTFPLRDSLINLNNVLKGSLKVENSVEIHGDLTVGDDIPLAEDNSSDSSSSQDVSSSETKDNVTSSESSSSTVTTDPQTVETLGAIIRVKNTAFEYYNFNHFYLYYYVAFYNSAAEIYEIAAKNAA